MQVFVAYAYHSQNEWIDRLVQRLIKALDCNFIDGKVAFGTSLAAEVLRIMEASDVVLVFTTKREGDHSNNISRWVDQELGAALGQKKQVIEILEKDVTSQLAMLAGAQHVSLDPEHRDECLVEIAEALKAVRDRSRIRTIKLLPQEVCAQIYPYVGKQSLSCRYRWRRKFAESPPVAAAPWRSQGNIFLDLRDVSEEDLIEISLEFADKRWESDYQPIDAIGIELREIKR